MKRLIIIMIFFNSILSFSQSTENILTLEEYLGYVKKYHPIVKQANLIITKGEVKLLKSRGAFDPKLQLNNSRKNFKGSEYYNKLNAVFKIPTWYGVEFKANFEQNDGKIYLVLECLCL